jgi:hypothetical protein
MRVRMFDGHYPSALYSSEKNNFVCGLENDLLNVDCLKNFERPAPVPRLVRHAYTQPLGSNRERDEDAYERMLKYEQNKRRFRPVSINGVELPGIQGIRPIRTLLIGGRRTGRRLAIQEIEQQEQWIFDLGTAAVSAGVNLQVAYDLIPKYSPFARHVVHTLQAGTMCRKARSQASPHDFPWLKRETIHVEVS